MANPAFSKLISGTMTWGKWGKNFDTNQMIDLLNFCVENGISTFDHADIYGDYTTETDFGLAFSGSGIRRENIQLISKCGIQMINDDRKTVVKHYDYSKKHIQNSVENSLRNLKTDYLDLMLLHRPSPLMQPDEIAEVVQKLQKEGKILAFGVSNFTENQIKLLHEKIKIDYNQISFSLTNHEAMIDGSLDFMKTQNIVPMAWNPLGSFFKNNDTKSVRIKNLAEQLTPKYQVETDVLLINWILKHPSGILPVFGTTNKTRISKLIAATNFEMDLEDWFALWTESMGNKVA
jgi:predicted oxidoreductase